MPPHQGRGGDAVSNDDEIESLESVFDALDRDDAATALALARSAMDSASEPDPVLHYLAGRALLDLDRPAEAAEELGRAVGFDEQDPEFATYTAWALYRACRFEAGSQALRPALDATEILPESHYVQALLLEREGRTEEAERHFDRAAALDPEGFPRPTRFDEPEFRRRLEAAVNGLDDRFRPHLDEVTLLVEDLPSDALLSEEDPPLDPEQLLGLFVGVPLGEPCNLGPGGELPPRIYLFKRNLERFASDEADLDEQIRMTLYHELGHYLGMDEDELEKLGYG